MKRFAAETASALADRAEDIAVGLLGKPTIASRHEMRWGNKGSIALQRTGKYRGDWRDFEKDERGDLLDLIARERGVVIADAIAIARREFLGQADAKHVSHSPASPVNLTSSADRTVVALRTWQQSGLIAGTSGEQYFVEQRNLDVSRLDLHHVLRWHSGIGAVVALMTDVVTNKPTGIHRTFLNEDGTKRERKMLGRKGVIRLSADEDVTLGLGLVEGVEDGLAVLLSGWAPVWCAADAGALAHFPALSGIEALTIFADADTAGERAAKQCAERWMEAGREVRISPPPTVTHA